MCSTWPWRPSTCTAGGSCSRRPAIYGDQVVDVLDSDDGALARGDERFGNVPFLVKEITEANVPIHMMSVLFGMESRAPDPLQWTTARLRADGPVIELGVAVAESLSASSDRSVSPSRPLAPSCA